MKSTNFFKFFLLLFLLLHIPHTVFGGYDPLLTNIKLANNQDDLIVYFYVEQIFTPKVIKAVHNGVPVTFSFYVSLYQIRASWLDKKIADIKVSSSIKYNALKREYIVSRLWMDEKSLKTKSFKEAVYWVTKIESLKVVELNRLVNGCQYQLRIKASLDKFALPFTINNIHNLFMLLSLWDVKTDWYALNFTF